MYMRIDKQKVKNRMAEVGILSFNELGEKTSVHGLGTRKLYDVLDGYNWSTGQLYALCNVLKCSLIDILSFDLDRTIPKVNAPNVIRNISFDLVMHRAA